MGVIDLFDMPTRQNSKSNDMKIARQSKVTKSTPTVIRGGSSLLDRISSAQKLVESKLGHLKDKYILIQDEETLKKYIDKSIENGVISIDTETTGLDPLLDDIAGICIYTPEMSSAYIPINHVSYITNQRIRNQLPISVIVPEFERLIAAVVDIIMFNAVFDIRVLRHIGLHKIYCTWDCYLAARILNENEPSNQLKPLHQKYVLNGEEDAFTFEELFNGIPFTLVPLKTAVLYAAHDPEITYEYYEYQHQFLREDSDREDFRAMYWAFKNIEIPCLDVVADMEDTGVLFDAEYREKLSIEYNKRLERALEAFYSELSKYDDKILKYKKKHVETKLDEPINIASTQQLAILFYDILGYDVVDKKKPRGTGEEILEKFDTPLAKLLVDYRKLAKLVDTYIDKMPNCVNPNDGRIHCKYNQYGADTGRFSSKNPNLQNIPSHNKDIRQMFIASPGYVLMSSDYSQQEPSCLATFCKQAGDDRLFNARFNGNDLYSEVASACFDKPYEECCEFDTNGHKNPPEYKERRNQAKPILLGILYGRGDASVAESLNCSLEDAQKLKQNLYRRFPEIQKFERDSLNMVQELGYVTTVCGRKRRLPDAQLDEYEFRWKNGVAPDNDLLDFDEEAEQEIPERTIRKYLTRLHNCRFKEKRRIFEQANEEGIWIIDNGVKISKAIRQTVNARIQGSAADLTKLALIKLNNDKRLKELGFRLLIPVHDEVIAECPEENTKECAERLAYVMSKAAEEILEMPFSCDVEITKSWYGKEVIYE